MLTVYGIETVKNAVSRFRASRVATVLTVYGIETITEAVKAIDLLVGCNSAYRLRY